MKPFNFLRYFRKGMQWDDRPKLARARPLCDHKRSLLPRPVRPIAGVEPHVRRSAKNRSKMRRVFQNDTKIAKSADVNELIKTVT